MNETIRQDLLAAGASETTYAQLLKFYFFRAHFKPVCLFRLYAHWYGQKGAFRKFIARLLYLRSIRNAGCDISPLATIGPGLSLHHPYGIVIGKDARIGENVTLYQNVTLGQKNKDEEGFPIIEDNTTIYAGACILGKTRIGKNAVIGANAVVLDDVPDNKTAAGIPARILKGKPALTVLRDKKTG